MTVGLARVALTHANTMFVLYFMRTLSAHTCTVFCMVWLDAPTEKGLSSKRLVY